MKVSSRPIKNIPVVRQFAKEKAEYQARSIVYQMIEKSGSVKFNKEMTARFNRQLNFAYKSKQITIRQREDLRKKFRKYQRELR